MVKGLTIRNDKWDKEKIKANRKLRKLCNFIVMLYVRCFYILKMYEHVY